MFVHLVTSSLFSPPCISDLVMASLPSSRLVCVALVTIMLVLYILAGSEGGHSDLDKREVKDWARLDLRALDLPSDIKDRVKKVKIEESHQDIHGANTFTQVSMWTVKQNYGSSN